MNEPNQKIVNALLNSLALLGAKSDLLGTVASWGDTLSDNDILAGINAWNESKENELKERLSLGSAKN
jgi:hypothetical protein